MTEAVEREDAHQHGHRRATGAREECVERGQVVHGLRLDPARPRLELPVEPLDLAPHLGGGRVQGRADEERRGLADRRARRVEPLVHPPDDLDEADPVHVEDRRRVRVVARARRVAGHREDIPDVERVGAEEVGLDPHEVPVAAGEMHVDVEPRRLADEERRRQHGHPDPAERPIVDVHDLDAALLEELRSLDELLDGVPPGRVELHRDDELALTQPALERRRRPQRAEARGLADRRRADADHRAARLASHAGLPIEHLAHGRDVLGRRAAAAADETRARVHHPAGVLGHVGGRREVDETLVDPAREPGVRLDRERDATGRRQHLLQHLVERARADRAVRAERLDAAPDEASRHVDRRAARERHALVRERHLRDDRQVGDGPHRLEGERDLGEIGERLDDERVHAALQERLGLLAERDARLLGRHGAEGRQVLAERADRAQHEDVAPGALADVAGEPHAPGVDLAHPIREPVDRELEAVRAEGVRLDAVGARGDVVGVDRLDDLRLVQVEDVEAGVERHAAGIEHRAHRAVAEERPRVEPAAKRVRHVPAGGPRAPAPRPGPGRARSCPR